METQVKKHYVKPEVRRHSILSRELICHARAMLITFALASCISGHAQVIVRNNTGKNDTLFARVSNYVCRELGIKDVELIISPIAFDKVLHWTEGGLAGVHRFDDHTFGINIHQSADKTMLTKLIIHELYHVRQILDKRLWISAKANWFEGILYTEANSLYEERPYETEAERFAYSFYKMHKKELKSIIKESDGKK